ncbi:ABC transporter permease [Martelella radicis]|uniref:Putative ABC transport system permease protein n=1 Tax=Martelella radicis TaxID=1397476 RepID=A0A7W6KJK9_9HYPH|nr:FtsX-like permease family protein [Martelella radicis]MBB4121085.1 putative ABC transport system permease protein [Martelella radicis]
MVAILDRKLLRDVRRLWAQLLAVALVLACGVAVLIMAVGVYRSLIETRDTFYDRYGFADVFASVTRAPDRLADEIRTIDGVLRADFRVVKPAILDIVGMEAPAAATVISTPDSGEPLLNRAYIRAGRLPDPNRVGEVAVSENFAKAHGFQSGDHFEALMDGKKRRLTITAIVLSPEYVYAIGPGDMVPDNSRYGILYMPESVLDGIFDMDGAFNDVALKLGRNANEDAVIERLDHLLSPYGGVGAYGRDRQISNAFVDSELTQLKAMAGVLPPIFLGVAAFLVNMVLSRMIALEREQIGLLKALGFSSGAIAAHYIKLTLVIVVIGTAIGFALGSWWGVAMTRLYVRFYTFPFLVFAWSPDVYLLAGSVAAAAALIGAARVIYSAASLPAAVAMRPPEPVRYRQLSLGFRLPRLLSELTVMALRNITRFPLRATMTVIGIAMPVALLTVGWSTSNSMDAMIRAIFFDTQRQDATVSFTDALAPEALVSLTRLPGVMRAEGFRAEPVILRNGYREKHLSISSASDLDDLSRVVDADAVQLSIPPEGLMISERVAETLGLATGDMAEVELVTRNHRLVRVPVTSVVQSFLGLAVYMDGKALDHMIGDGDRVSGANIAVDETRLASFYGAVKDTPRIAGVALNRLSLENFRKTMRENIDIMSTIYISLAAVITFGVVYNSARILLSERGRELASLRVLGFSRAEVSQVLLVEIAALITLAQPIGWYLGYFFAKLVISGFSSDLFTIPFVVDLDSYARASLVVVIAGLLSALVVRRRIDRFDLVEVLKTRE